jgi:hypothetical protein
VEVADIVHSAGKSVGEMKLRVIHGVLPFIPGAG